MCIPATDGGDKIQERKNKRAFGESVLHVLSKFEAWKIRDVVNENRNCCIYMHAAHTCYTEWEKIFTIWKSHRWKVFVF